MTIILTYPQILQTIATLCSARKYLSAKTNTIWKPVNRSAEQISGLVSIRYEPSPEGSSGHITVITKLNIFC